MQRDFSNAPARREKVPLLIGLMGCSGSGKTFSALRLAAGIQKISGGDIFVIDTESRRAAHYADSFTFQHVEFVTPFGSLDYLEALRFCVKKNAGVIVVDSMSHEHSGEGGYLDAHAAEVQRMSGGDPAKAERVKMAGWIKPAANRQRLINGILQLPANFIFCFRAKEKTKPKQGGGIQELGWMPIAGEEFLFEMTLNCLLPPNARGMPQWVSDFSGEKMMMKLPRQFEPIFADGRALDEAHGVALAEWARGTPGKIKAPSATEAPAKLTPAEWYERAASEIGACASINALNAWIDDKANGAAMNKLEIVDKPLSERLYKLIGARADELNAR